MKRVLAILVLSLACRLVHTDVLVLSGNVFVAKPTLAAALTAPDTAGKTIVITSPQRVETLVTPADRPIEIQGGGSIEVAAGHAFTIGGSFRGGRNCLRGPGIVKFAVCPGEVDPAWWGADPSGVADSAPAINAAIQSLPGIKGETTGGRVRLGAGRFRLRSPVVIDRTIIFEGQGAAGGPGWFPATALLCDPGVTGIKVRSYSGIPAGSEGYGDNWGVIKDLAIGAAGKLTTSVMGSYGTGTFTVTLEAPGDFVDGQLICVQGAGTPMIYPNVAGDMEKGSNKLVVSMPAIEYPYAAIPPGQVVAVQGAGLPDGTTVTAPPELDGKTHTLTFTLSAPATAAVRAAAITIREDLYAEIVSGGGTKTLTIGSFSNYPSVTHAAVTHADAGILAGTIFVTEGFLAISGFAGPGLYIRASHGDKPASNANVFRLGKGRSNNNRIGILVSGEDANAGNCQGFDVMSNAQFGLVDDSLLGNTWNGMHVSGGYGYKVTKDVANALFVGCYAEGGTWNVFARGTVAIGGTGLGQFDGGNVISYQGGGRLSLPPSTVGNLNIQGSYELGLMDWGWNTASLRIQKRGGMSQFLRKPEPGEGELGWWGWAPNGRNDRVPFAWSDADAATGIGSFWLPRGVYLGSAAGTAMLSNARRCSVGSDPTGTAGTQGDIVFNIAPTAGGIAGWSCTQTGEAGAAVWKPWARIAP